MICCNYLATCIYFILIIGTYSNNFISFGDYEYYFGNESQRGNYFYAQQECFKRNSTLVVIYTEEINQFIKENVNGTEVNYFIGLQKIDQYDVNRSYLWIGKTTPSFFDWGPRQPSNEEEICVEIARYQYQWNDVHCNEANRSTFICQKKVQSCEINNPCGENSHCENSHCDNSTGFIRCLCNSSDDQDWLPIVIAIVASLIAIEIVFGIVAYILCKKKKKQTKISQNEQSEKSISKRDGNTTIYENDENHTVEADNNIATDESPYNVLNETPSAKQTEKQDDRQTYDTIQK